jgi:hypothetical protein
MKMLTAVSSITEEVFLFPLNKADDNISRNWVEIEVDFSEVSQEEAFDDEIVWTRNGETWKPRREESLPEDFDTSTVIGRPVSHQIWLWRQ